MKMRPTTTRTNLPRRTVEPLRLFGTNQRPVGPILSGEIVLSLLLFVLGAGICSIQFKSQHVMCRSCCLPASAICFFAFSFPNFLAGEHADVISTSSSRHVEVSASFGSPFRLMECHLSDLKISRTSPIDAYVARDASVFFEEAIPLVVVFAPCFPHALLFACVASVVCAAVARKASAQAASNLLLCVVALLCASAPAQ